MHFVLMQIVLFLFACLRLKANATLNQIHTSVLTSSAFFSATYWLPEVPLPPRWDTTSE